MKKKKVISTIILFGLALSSCERCSDDTKDRNVTNRNVTNDKEILAEKELTEEDKFYSEAQVAWDAVSEAFRVVDSDRNTLNEAQARETVAESFDKLALILDRGESKNWKFISRSNNIGEPNAEYCRGAAASDAQEEADRVSVELGTKDAIVGVVTVMRHLIVPIAPLPDPECSICFGGIKDPRKCPECNHQFCYGCIVQWLNKNSICPACKRDIKSMPNRRDF